MPPSEIVFDEEIALDLMWLTGKAFPHVLDTQAHLNNAEILPGQSVEDVWRSVINCWVSMYAGFPSKMSLYQRSAYTCPRWNQLSEIVGIHLQVFGVESHNSLGPVERYHDPPHSENQGRPPDSGRRVCVPARSQFCELQNWTRRVNTCSPRF